MASVTRSSRRAEVPRSHSNPHPHHLTTSSPGLFAANNGAGSGGGSGRNKRPLDNHNHDFDAINPKRTRISVEIYAKGTLGNVSNAYDNKVPPARTNLRPATAATPVVASATTTHTPDATTKPPTTDAATPAVKPEQSLTKHQAKVINGIKHELDRLQPQAKDTSTREQGRKLRSQEATRFKSELSAYFPEYDEIIGNEPIEQRTYTDPIILRSFSRPKPSLTISPLLDLLNLDTPIVIVESGPVRAVQGPQFAVPHHADLYPVRGYGDVLFNDVFDAQRIDFNFLEAQFKNRALEDPLPDKLFQPVHRRAERLERSIRNTEKGRAQHEKDQIIRLLEGLQGHDWLRIMGVSGVTETRKKTFEPARDHFIKGCQAILAKFRNWILEEKRRKQEKEKALAEKAEEEADGSARGDDDDEGTPEDSSDSASPAKQLREEAMARSKASAKSSKKRKATPQPAASKAPRPSKPPPPPRPPTAPKPPEPPREFKSFFSKRHERDGALHRNRRAGRKVLAWGHPIPEIPQIDFVLPEEFRDEDTLKARARKKRLDRRGKKA